MKNIKKTITVGFIALGCPKNIIDSERMLAEIGQAGFLIATELADSDVIVINTCGFITPAQQEALEAIEQAVKYKKQGNVKKVVVAGCLSERLKDKLFEKADGIDAIVGLGQRDDIAAIIGKTLNSEKPAAYLKPSCDAITDDRSRLLITAQHWAYLRISEGCNHNCSFCTIPAIRGRFRSKPQEQILAEAEELASAGVVELNIIAQDTTNYGKDLKIRDGLAKLLKELEKIKRFEWIRLMYLNPSGITDGLIETVANSKKIVRYFDIPVQHINNKILKDMYRPDTKESICKLIEKIRNAMPDAVLRTTVIVGFPGETDEQFTELLNFVKWAQFDALGCFKYYPEVDTKAAEMQGQSSEPEKEQRLKELMLTQQQIAFARNKKRIGMQLKCLVDSVGSKKNGNGRYYGQAPEIDSMCVVKNCRVPIGSFIETKVIAAKGYDLIVKQILS